MSDEELQAIRARQQRMTGPSRLDAEWVALATKAGTEDAPLLLAEVERLRALLEQTEKLRGHLDEAHTALDASNAACPHDDCW